LAAQEKAMLSPNELVDRWKTSAGAALRDRVISALLTNEDIRPILKKLPGSEEIFDWTDLRGIDLSGLSLSTGSFVAASLDFGCFDGCRFTRTFFDNASLLYARFNGAKLIKSQITAALVLHSSFEHADFEEVLLMTSNISYCSFHEAVLKDCDFGRCRCVSDDFANATIHRVNFESANLAHVKFSGAHNFGSNFQGAKLHETVLPNTQLKKGSIEIARVDVATGVGRQTGVRSADVRNVEGQTS
jgi:uncharacterized protein YjbI with pentapeptide repeats